MNEAAIKVILGMLITSKNWRELIRTHREEKRNTDFERFMYRSLAANMNKTFDVQQRENFLIRKLSSSFFYYSFYYYLLL